MHQCIKCGQVIAQGLTAGTGCGYYDILAGKDGVQGFCLVAVESGYSQGFQAFLKAGVKGLIQFGESRALMRNSFDMYNLLAIVS